MGDNGCKVALKVLEGGELPVGLNKTFAMLIPKTNHPKMVLQFRPIGLCNVAYKLITKCMVNRLKRILPEVTSPLQSSFVPG